MLFDEPTAGLDPLNEAQVLDLVIRARDLHGISSLVVTKQLHQIPYLATRRAAEDTNGTVVIREAAPGEAPDVKVMFLHRGRVAFFGTPAEFAADTSPGVLYMTRAGRGTHTVGVVAADPWDKRRRPKRSAVITSVEG
jgi:ABC-type multidrug transport system ATPase subunit